MLMSEVPLITNQKTNLHTQPLDAHATAPLTAAPLALHKTLISNMKRELNSNVSSIEISYMNYLILLVKNMLCSKLHFQKDFNLTLFSCKIPTPSTAKAASHPEQSLDAHADDDLSPEVRSSERE